MAEMRIDGLVNWIGDVLLFENEWADGGRTVGLLGQHLSLKPSSENTGWVCM
jgi:hypothetical protein